MDQAVEQAVTELVLIWAGRLFMMYYGWNLLPHPCLGRSPS